MSVFTTIDEGDFASTPETLFFQAESLAGAVQCATFRIFDDTVQEGEELVTINADREDLFSDSSATIVITDNDGT